MVVNKWDTVEKETNTMNEYETDYRSQLRDISWAPYIFTSALTGQRVKNIVAEIQKVGEQYNRRVTTGLLNVVVQVRMDFPPGSPSYMRQGCTQRRGGERSRGRGG